MNLFGDFRLFAGRKSEKLVENKENIQRHALHRTVLDLSRDASTSFNRKMSEVDGSSKQHAGS
jgi:hypothetical protein